MPLQFRSFQSSTFQKIGSTNAALPMQPSICLTASILLAGQINRQRTHTVEPRATPSQLLGHPNRGRPLHPSPAPAIRDLPFGVPGEKAGILFQPTVPPPSPSPVHSGSHCIDEGIFSVLSNVLQWKFWMAMWNLAWKANHTLLPKIASGCERKAACRDALTAGNTDAGEDRTHPVPRSGRHSGLGGSYFPGRMDR